MFMKTGEDSCRRDLIDLSFTAEGALWWAPAEHNWCTSKQNLRHLPIAFRDWDTDIAMVRPDEAEELGVLIMALSRGVNKCCEWLGPELLAKYDLDWNYKET